MTFRENMLKKIEMRRLARKVTASLVPSGDVQGVDKQGMRRLLTMAGYERRDIRDLELYLPKQARRHPHIIVLDNGLGLYETDMEDVAMRKSPTVREMVSIRNAVKILRDQDVLRCKKADTVSRVAAEFTDSLDLAYTADDIDAIRLDGTASLESGYAEGVVEATEIFGEILGYEPPPKAFSLRHSHVTGRRTNTTYGPVVLFDRVHRRLRLMDHPVDASDPSAMARFQKIADGTEKAPVEGGAVFDWLAGAAMEGKGPA